MDIVNDPSQYKGLAHTEEERNDLGLRGLLPAAVRSVDLQLELCLHTLEKFDSDLLKYLFLRKLQDTNERLFYYLLGENIKELMPLIYTPTVGEACLKYSEIFRRPKGIFITINDSGSIYDVLGNYPIKEIKGLVVTDGERILGLGDLGANGMGISVGKLTLYTAAGGINPRCLLPVTLDVGTNNKQLLDDPFYIGLRQQRVKGEEYDEFLDEFMKAVVKRYGQTCLIQFEDFGNKNAFALLNRYKEHYCTFNDDIQGTASVAVAGILCALDVTGTELNEHTLLFYGAGQAALGIADLLVLHMQDEGVSEEDAIKMIWMVDSKGLITSSRKSSELTEQKKRYVKDHAELVKLDEVVKEVKPTILIGAAAQFGVFTEEVLSNMAETCKQPIIFALSNPTSKTECTPEEAFRYTDGKCIYASGTAFPPFTYKDKTYQLSQANNAYIFPGISLALIACQAKTVDDKVLLTAARALASQVINEDMAEGKLYPPLSQLRKISLLIATKIAEYLYQEDLAALQPKPDDLEVFMRSEQYDYHY